MSSRRRQTPWMHRWSRQLIGAIATFGAINTGYITITKLLNAEAACPTQGCERVLASPYAYVFGLPLSLFGLLAYLAILVFALVPLAINPDKNKPLRTEAENWTWLLLFIGSTAMMVFSAYLMYIMATEFVAVYGASGLCYYCIASALFATALFFLTLFGRAWEDAGQLFFTGIIVGVVVLIGTLGVYANVNNPGQGGSAVAGQAGPPITTTSGSAEVALARHLKEVGARMYGAYWCPHCHDQKQLFGQQAAQQINYVECDPGGQNPQVSLCQENSENVTGYPTWEINGQFYPGTQTLDQLADASGYQGPRNFRNSL
jgi:uncharacterized membrane protein/glutaredoxin